MTRTPGEYVYHAGYLPRGLESVKRKGLIPSKHGYAGSGVYFAYEPDEGFYHVDAADATMFRVRWADLVDKFGVYPKNPNGIQRDDQEIIVPNTVPADMLEVEYFPGEWWDINSAVAADRGPPVNEAVLVTDVPREEWLEDKIAYAKKRGRNSFGVPYMGSTTAYVRQPSHVVLPVSLLARIPGARGEQKNVRQEDLTAIMKIMKDTGKLPLTSRGEEYKPFVCVAWNGEPWVMEGNHRIMAAKQLGWETLPVELKYFDGGERIRSGVLYPGKIGLGDVNNSHETDEDPLVVVYDKDGELHTHANLSVANNIFRTDVKPNDVIKEPVKVKSGGSYGEVTFALSKHHKSESLNPAPGTSVVMNEAPIKLKSQDSGRARKFIDAVYARYPYTFQNNHVMSWGSGEEQEVAMFELVPSFGRPNAVEIKWIQAYPLRKGVGSRAMKELQGMAQEHGVALTLFPWDKGRVSQAKLMKFYRGHGFQPTVKGAKNMIWHPEVAEASLATMRDYFAGNDKAKDPTKLSVMRNYFNQVDGSTNVNRAPGKSGKNPAGIPPEIQALVNKMYHSGKISPQEYEILRKFQQQTKINVGVREAEEDNKCPPATQDITLNLENRQKAIDEYGYGPLNPDLPNNKFWMKKVNEWNLDSPEEAKQSLCGNCAAFDKRKETLDCIAQGIGSDQGAEDPTINAGDLGYCRFLKFKCASRRTCDAWVTGGPLVDSVAEAETGTAHARDISREFRKLGYSKIGSGADSTIWAKDDSHVIKILMPEDEGSQAVEVFKKFYEFCQERSDIPCLPVFNEYNTIDVLDKEYIQIDMERLYPIKKNTFEEAMVWYLSDYVAHGTPWNQVKQELSDPHPWINSHWPRRADQLAAKVSSLSGAAESAWNLLYSVMAMLYKTGRINKLGWDLHTENVMRRANGQLVIIDPWFADASLLAENSVAESKDEENSVREAQNGIGSVKSVFGDVDDMKAMTQLSIEQLNKALSMGLGNGTIVGRKFSGYDGSAFRYDVKLSDGEWKALTIIINPQGRVYGWLGDTVFENFADGKKPGRKGLAKRMGVDCSKSVAELRRLAAASSGEKQRMAHWCANMKSGRNESIAEGGWASTATQNTKITPAVIEEAVGILKEFETEFNQWQAEKGLDVEIKMGKPVGSGTYYKRDLAQDPEREYGDVDVMCYIHSREGIGAARRTAEYAAAVEEFTQGHSKYSTSNGTNVIMDTSAGPVQVDLIYTYHEHANWARMLAPEYRVKGVINTSLVSSLAEVLNLSIGVQGVQVKTRAGRPVNFRQSKDTELATVSLDPENWGADIYAYYYELAHGAKPKIPSNLAKHGGLKDEQRISDIVLTIKALATDLEQAKLLGTGALDHVANKQDMMQQIARVLDSKLEKVINSSKFDKAATPAAVEKANKTKLMLAKYRNEITKLLLN